MKTLVVGGTGMLLGLVRELLAAGDEVWTLARHAPALTHSRLHPLLADYRDAAALRAALASAAPFDRAVVWIHSAAPDAPFVVAEAVQGPFFHVLGSAAADPSRPDDGRRTRFAAQGTDHREIVLGFVREGARSRWLTDAEISAGVWEAVRGDLRRAVVGTVTPWEARPG
ncbi:Rossmann-fold NAD(P)-binding domain-containing protein [Deinococcus sp. PESE-13]